MQPCPVVIPFRVQPNLAHHQLMRQQVESIVSLQIAIHQLINQRHTSECLQLGWIGNDGVVIVLRYNHPLVISIDALYLL